jgi:hypothetical protein
MAKTALEWISELSNGKDQAFPSVKRADVVDGLKTRLAKPQLIDQANTSLCGCACLMYCLAKLKDAVYAQYVVELYQTGKGKIGSLSVEPSSDCKKYAPSTAKGIHPVDWLALASLRDSENDLFDYQSPSNEVGGITMPGDLVDWFKDAGFSKDANITNLVFTKGEGTIKDAGTRYSNNHSVCLFINANLLNNPSDSSTFPDHWVVMTSPVTTDKGQVKLSVFSWGDIHPIDLKVDVFCKNFYGFISSSSI